jgi:hypothetical protein
MLFQVLVDHPDILRYFKGFPEHMVVDTLEYIIRVFACNLPGIVDQSAGQRLHLAFPRIKAIDLQYRVGHSGNESEEMLNIGGIALI